MDLFESSKIPLVILWIILIVIEIGIFAVSMASYFILKDQVQKLSEYETVFIRYPSNYVLPTIQESIPYQSNSFPYCPSSFEAPLAFMSMSLLHFMHLKGKYYYKNNDKTFLNGNDYSFDCHSFIKQVEKYCTSPERNNTNQCKEYLREPTSSIGPLIQYMLCESSSDCPPDVIESHKLFLKFLHQNKTLTGVEVSGRMGINATLLVSEAKRFMTIYHQPVLLTFDDFVDRTIISSSLRKDNDHPIQCAYNVTQKCYYQDTPIRTFDGYYHDSNILYSTGKLKSVVVVGWDDNYPIPRTNDKGALFVRDEGATTGHSLEYYIDDIQPSGSVLNANDDFERCGNIHSFLHWNDTSPLHLNKTNYLKYMYEYPEGINENTYNTFTYYITNRTSRNREGLMSIDMKAVNEKTTIHFQMNGVTDSLMEQAFYEEMDDSIKHNCGYYAIGYNTIQRYFTSHYDTQTNPVGFSFIHLKWPDSSCELIRE
ncbi:hypothetical protein EDI_083710 [Entamoeba dispar SAW760]|uniref:Uncharacterized protein n=1 Tax=Entamoeba dispar (strain ATCC PRA-260 / SAW760) TaxID=370354 RepID=B0EPD1_ENTDS|nr:uncharacterized protein EDI_083710 [Entamoeba dispar SAW760]EDR23614.1 hypothetical protein EDI_083710 [Entamoeba dispar SAW760]|eukprot:EDR23614.1 hypothetical protein EDI_083710 [Entamoeba dispar SAW760]